MGVTDRGLVNRHLETSNGVLHVVETTTNAIYYIVATWKSYLRAYQKRSPLFVLQQKFSKSLENTRLFNGNVVLTLVKTLKTLCSHTTILP